MSTSAINIIQPVQVPQTAKKIELFLQYVFNAVEATVLVDYKDDNGAVIKTASVYILPEVYSIWQQDSVIIDYVLSQLCLTTI